MKYESTATHNDLTITVTVDLPNRELSHGDELVLDHYMRLEARRAIRVYLQKVCTWGQRRRVLLTLSEADARILGLHREWKRAQDRELAFFPPPPSHVTVKEA